MARVTPVGDRPSSGGPDADRLLQVYLRQLGTATLSRRREIELCQSLEKAERRICRALGRNPVVLRQALGILEAAKKHRRSAGRRSPGDPGQQLDAGARDRIWRTLAAFGRIRELEGEIGALRRARRRLDCREPEHQEIERRIDRRRVRIRRQVQAIGVRRRLRLGAILRRAVEDVRRARDGLRRVEQALERETDEVLRAVLERRLRQLRAELEALEERYGITSFDEVARAAPDIRRGEEAYAAARDQLIAANLRAVVRIAEKFTGRGQRTGGKLELLDLIQEGNVVLMKAIDRFDYRRGVRLWSFAVRRIHYELVHAVDERARVIRLPRHRVETLRKLRSTDAELLCELGREPTDGEIGERVGLSVAKVRHLRAAAHVPLSLDALLTEPADFDVQDPQAVSPLAAVIDAEMRAAVRRELECLTPLQELVLRLRFGFDGAKLTHEEVGRVLGRSGGRASQIQARALLRLWHRACFDGSSELRVYLES
jgi:RNA polymerase primary sigma factor